MRGALDVADDLEGESFEVGSVFTEVFEGEDEEETAAVGSDLTSSIATEVGSSFTAFASVLIGSSLTSTFDSVEDSCFTTAAAAGAASSDLLSAFTFFFDAEVESVSFI